MCFFLTQVLYLIPWGACAFYAPIYSFQFNSFQFISFLFYSAWRKKRNVTNDNEKKRKLRKITKITKYYEKKEKNEKYRKLRNITKKRNNVVKKITIAWYFMLKLYTFSYMLRMSLLQFFFFFVRFSFFRSFSFFSLISFLFVIYELQFFY